ncbi:MAG: glycosyltransferase family 2 protein, partial [bacterium]|nr:glycosyltransferase family 2 protein [bacterium]
MKQTPFVSVVVLGYKAGEQLQNLVERLGSLLKKTRWEYEIILVANYWRDKNDPTPSVAHRISQSIHHVSAISHPKQGGMGWDVLSGLKKARGEILVFVDGDAQNPLEDVVRTVRALQRKKADLVKTVRIQRFDGVVRAVQSVWYNRFFRWMYGMNMNDVNGKPKAM